MSCPVDALAWGESNRVRVFTGKRQRWVLARTTRDNPTVASVPLTAKAVMGKWFEGTPLDVQFADAGDAVDDITVTNVSEELPPAPSGSQRREALDPVPLLAPSPRPPLFVTVEFNYRGYGKDLPWPVWTAPLLAFTREAKLCPLDCDWMLAWAAPEVGLAVAPDEEGLLDKLVHHAPGPLATAAEIVQLAGYGLAAYLTWQVFATLAPTLKPLRRRS